jgi:hypothetical protein
MTNLENNDEIETTKRLSDVFEDEFIVESNSPESPPRVSKGAMENDDK